MRIHIIRQAVQEAPERRTEDHIDAILELVQDVKFFARLSTEQQRSLCRLMTMEVFAKDDYIFQKGDLGEKYYIIVSGHCSLMTAAASNSVPTPEQGESPPKEELETARFMGRGEGFGELALQSDNPRSASVRAEEAMEVLVTTKAHYQLFAGEKHKVFIEQRVRFLKSCSRIGEAENNGLVTPQDIAAVANCFSEVSLSGNNFIARQGDRAESVVFVRSGQLAMLRIIDGRIADGNSPRRMVLRIGAIGPFQYFGDRQISRGERLPVSLVSDPHAELYIVSRGDLTRRLPRKVFNELFPDKEDVPNDAQILEMHRQTKRWAAFRQSLHSEALLRRKERNIHSRFRADTHGHAGVDTHANLNFIGISPKSTLGQQLLAPPKRTGVTLTPQDEELFSQVDASFLRRLEEFAPRQPDTSPRNGGSIGVPPRPRQALGDAARARTAVLAATRCSSVQFSDATLSATLGRLHRRKNMDPMRFKFDQQWDGLRKDSVFDLVEIDVDEELTVDDLPTRPLNAMSMAISAALPGRASSSSSPRPGSRQASSYRRQRTNRTVSQPASRQTTRSSFESSAYARSEFGSLRSELGDESTTSTSGVSFAVPRESPLQFDHRFPAAAGSSRATSATPATATPTPEPARASTASNSKDNRRSVRWAPVEAVLEMEM